MGYEDFEDDAFEEYKGMLADDPDGALDKLWHVLYGCREMSRAEQYLDEAERAFPGIKDRLYGSVKKKLDLERDHRRLIADCDKYPKDVYYKKLNRIVQDRNDVDLLIQIQIKKLKSGYVPPTGEIKGEVAHFDGILEETEEQRIFGERSRRRSERTLRSYYEYGDDPEAAYYI